MHESLSTSLILRGIGAVALGIMALVWPGVTVLVLVILFAVFAFIAAGVQAILAFSSTTGGRVFGHLLLGLADLAAGVIALAWPGPTALVLVLIVGCWAIFVGLFQVFVVSRAPELTKSRALFILGGLGAVAFGVSLFARPTIGAVTIAQMFGMFSLTNGATMVMQGVRLRPAPETPQSVQAERTTA
jgi:uncharacterized membrane protein HdeD (DUF308 family)